MIIKNEGLISIMELLYKVSCFMRLDREKAWIGYAIAFFISLIITVDCNFDQPQTITMVFGTLSVLLLMLMYLSIFIRGEIIRLEVNGKLFNREDNLKAEINSDIDKMLLEVKEKRLNACRVLNIDYGSDQDKIKLAYRSMAKKYHPDSNPGNPGAQADFVAVQKAYEYLKERK